jgi:hypothetical protein
VVIDNRLTKQLIIRHKLQQYVQEPDFMLAFKLTIRKLGDPDIQDTKKFVSTIDGIMKRLKSASRP